jgi:hypothetical protein
MLLVVVSEAWIFLQSFYSTSTTLVTTDHNLLLDDAQHRSHSRPRKRTGEMRGCSSPALRCYWATERMLNWAFFCGWCPLNSEKKECSTGPILLLPYYGLDRFPSEQHHFKKKSNTKHRLKPSTETHLNEQSNPSQTNKTDGVSRRCGTRSHELIGRLKVHLFIITSTVDRSTTLPPKRRLQAETAAGAASSGGARRRPQTEPGGR